MWIRGPWSMASVREAASGEQAVTFILLVWGVFVFSDRVSLHSNLF